MHKVELKLGRIWIKITKTTNMMIQGKPMDQPTQR